MATTDTYEIPPFDANQQLIFNWCLQAQQEAEGWLKAQQPAVQWDSALQVLSAPDGGTTAAVEGLSNLGYNKVKRIARELVASLGNFRHEGEYKPRWDQTLYDVAHTLTQLDENWYKTTKANIAHRQGLQYGIGLGTAYFYEIWDKHYHSPFRGDIRLQAISPSNVSFVQLPADHDIQRAYAVIIREEMPLNLAKAVYSETNAEFAKQLVPDRDSPGWLQKGLHKLQQFVAPALRLAGRTNADQRSSFPTVDIFHMYVNDRSVNTSGAPRQMGAHGTNWSYTVPSLGDPIQTNQKNPDTNDYFTIPATEAHCRLFPLRRYVIFSRTALCYDGSSPWWHGQVPLTRLRFSDWAWEALGQSQIADLRTMQDGIIALMRLIEDAAAARLDPGIIYDDALGRTWAEALNPRKAGTRAAAPMSQLGGEMLRPVLPAEYYNTPQGIYDWIASQEARMDYQAAVTDMVAIAKAKQIPGADTLEKIMEMAGPIVQDLVRAVEEPLTDLGNWRLAYYFQFYTAQRMLQLTGPDGVEIDKVYRPEQLAAIRPLETNEQFALRKRGMITDFRYAITESGINEIHRMTNKLFYTQLYKMGFPISPWTLAKVAQIPNFGPEPLGTNNEMERWIAWQRIQIDLAMDQQEQVAMRMGGIAPPGMEGSPTDVVNRAGGAVAGTGQPSDNGGGGGPEGRPPSFSAPPRLQSKDSGSRATITTSR